MALSPYVERCGFLVVANASCANVIGYAPRAYGNRLSTAFHKCLDSEPRLSCDVWLPSRHGLERQTPLLTVLTRLDRARAEGYESGRRAVPHSTQPDAFCDDRLDAFIDVFMCCATARAFAAPSPEHQWRVILPHRVRR